jgi:hypothetical protein
MNKTFALFVCVLCLVTSASIAQAQAARGGASQYPRNDRIDASIPRNLPAPVQIRGDVRPGHILARGRNVDLNRDRVLADDECEFNYGFSVALWSGRREVTVRHLPGCTAVIEEIRDINAVEVQDRVAALKRSDPPTTPRTVLGRLWDAIFPTASAQTWINKVVYGDIYTYGYAGAGADGLTAQQGWLYFRYSGSSAIMNSANGWFCVDGRNPQGQSWCQPPLGIPPMGPYHTAWWGQNPWIIQRSWGPSPTVVAEEQTEFFWDPQSCPLCPEFRHQLHNRRIAYAQGWGECPRWVTGSIPNSYYTSACQVTTY